MKARALLPALGFLVLAGCGGGGGQSQGLTRLSVRAQWPSLAGRVIPTAAQSIQVQLLQNGNVTNSALLTPGSPNASFTEVPVGSVTVQAVAYPTAAGTGTAMAAGSVVQTITSGSTANVNLTMASTIDHLAITPNPVDLALTGIVTRQIAVTAYDASNAVVLTSASDLSYSSSGLSVFIVSPTGLVTGLAVGNATLTATDAISGKSVTATVHVTIN